MYVTYIVFQLKCILKAEYLVVLDYWFSEKDKIFVFMECRFPVYLVNLGDLCLIMCIRRRESLLVLGSVVW